MNRKHERALTGNMAAVGWTEYNVQETQNEQIKHEYSQCSQHLLKEAMQFQSTSAICHMPKIAINWSLLFFK